MKKQKLSVSGLWSVGVGVGIGVEIVIEWWMIVGKGGGRIRVRGVGVFD